MSVCRRQQPSSAKKSTQSLECVEKCVAGRKNALRILTHVSLPSTQDACTAGPRRVRPMQRARRDRTGRPAAAAALRCAVDFRPVVRGEPNHCVVVVPEPFQRPEHGPDPLVELIEAGVEIELGARVPGRTGQGRQAGLRLVALGALGRRPDVRDVAVVERDLCHEGSTIAGLGKADEAVGQVIVGVIVGRRVGQVGHAVGGVGVVPPLHTQGGATSSRAEDRLVEEGDRRSAGQQQQQKNRQGMRT
eukprot:SAG22_NODE_400_length_11089_cov_6.934668_9_plen_247_part_00